MEKKFGKPNVASESHWPQNFSKTFPRTLDCELDQLWIGIRRGWCSSTTIFHSCGIIGKLYFGGISNNVASTAGHLADLADSE